ncbi:MFS transporter [Amycolatopsis sp. NBC_00345]|uniref:MDR family MFS transporter n=1 Tax=Amycolatopsis sp. NBC_00345 TaxID=2975955 RepID=UPI002E275BA5
MNAPATLTSGRRTLVLAAILLAMLLSALDQTIVSTALPTIVSDLGGGTHLSWVVTAYLLAETIMTVLVGKFGDLFGRKITFMISVVLFLAGSFFAGWSNSIEMLIAFRALQGLGGGGLMVTATALIADVVPLRERGKFQGIVGAVFGVSTVAGPLLGGLFVDHFGWRWTFYVNIPLGILVLIVAAVALPKIAVSGRPKIDYAGIALIALAATGLTLVTSWGGSQYPWGSPVIIGMAVGSVVLLVAFVFVERRAEEPMLPMRLFSSRVFTVSGVLSFVVGFAMLGGITYLPTYLQYVRGVSATESGLWMLPLVFGLMGTALVSGNAIGKTGRYRVFPIIGSVLMTVGLFLLSRLGVDTNFFVVCVYMLVLGAGIGLIMQVPTIVVQSTSDYADLGVATSGVSFLRSMGSSFGVAMFGTVYASKLPGNIAAALAAHPLPPGTDPRAVQEPALLHTLPPEISAAVIGAYSDTVRSVFLIAAPIGLIALVVALLMPEVPLRDTSRAAVAGGNAVGEGFAPPASGDSERTLETLIARIVHDVKGDPTPEIFAKTGLTITMAQGWLIGQIYRHAREDGDATMDELGQEHKIPAGIFEPTARRLADLGYVTEQGGHYRFTEAGAEVFATLITAWRGWLLEKLEDWNETDQRQFASAIDSLAGQLISEGRSLSRA